MLRPSIILSTYNAPDWLARSLCGFKHQSHSGFEIVIADDGSTPETRLAIEQFRKHCSIPITHVWQEDRGFRKTRILNKAILAAAGNYLIFTDGDCIPRHDFVEIHAQMARPGIFLSGGYFKLSQRVSELTDEATIAKGQAFDSDWIEAQGQKIPLHKRLKLTAKGRQSDWLNRLTPTRASWNGHNASAFKDAIIAVNGFDERMGYGGEDRELGERLLNAGVMPRQIRYSAVCLHLEHERDYVTKSDRHRNDRIRMEVAAARSTQTAFGLNLHSC